MVRLEQEIVLKAAWYYYMESYTQQQISRMLGISRAKVIRLLNEARDEGIIQFGFRREDTGRMRIERALIDRFGLQDVFLVPTPSESAALGDSLARAASIYILDHVRPDGFLNIGYGDTMGLVLNQLAASRRNDLNIVSLTGGVNYYLPQVVSGVFGMKLFVTPAPLIVSTHELRDLLLLEPSIQDVYRMTAHADMSVMGIGGVEEDATVLRNGILSKNELALLKMQGARGDILNHFIDRAGEPIAQKIDDRTISTGLEALQSMKNVVGVAGGPSKIAAIGAVLAHRYLDVLVTDEQTAQDLLDASAD